MNWSGFDLMFYSFFHFALPVLSCLISEGFDTLFVQHCLTTHVDSMLLAGRSFHSIIFQTLLLIFMFGSAFEW